MRAQLDQDVADDLPADRYSTAPFIGIEPWATATGRRRWVGTVRDGWTVIPCQHIERGHRDAAAALKCAHRLFVQYEAGTVRL